MQIAKKEVGETFVKFTWADETSTIVDVTKLNEAIQNRAMIHGLSQKLGDSYSQAGGDVAKAKIMFQETLDALMEGDWNRKGGGFSSGGIWVEALAKAAGVTVEEALEKWNELDDAGKSEIRKDARVKLAKAEIEVERAQAKAADAGEFTL